MRPLENPYSLPVAELERLLETSCREGLTEARVVERRQEFGENRLPTGAGLSPWRIFLHQFQDLMVLILVAAAGVAVLSWVLDGCRGWPSDALIIGAILVFNAVLGFAQEFKAEKTLQELQRTTTSRTQVVRGGRAQMVELFELVPGDVVLLGEGDRVPADAVLAEAQHLQVNESLLTGEAMVVSKSVGPVAPGSPVDSRTGEVFAGTTVTSGTARALVVGTGTTTELGSIALSLATTASEPTPLERRLARLGVQIGWGVLLLSGLVGATVLALEPRWDAPTLVRVLMYSVALAVAAVPEGLPAVLTISLSAGVRRLARQQAVARRMSAVETLGSVSVIVTDKTGTLTHNQMTVESLYFDGQSRSVSGRGYAEPGSIEGEPALAGTLGWLVEAGVFANSGDLEEREGRLQALGDPVDAGLLVLAQKAGLDWRALRERPSLAEAPFTSERARVSSLREGGCLYVKGSLQEVGSRADRVMQDGEIVPLTPECLREWGEVESAYAARALRTLALAVRPGAPEGDAADLEAQLVLVGLVAMRDPVRAEVGPALNECRRAGVRVVMLTGDHPQTALAVAREIGLAGPEEEAMTGPDFGDLARSVRTHSVFARVSPQSKLALVQALLDQGEVVAMTGDGVNDAPALKKVHVGIAMGSGTAVAIEAADMVLLDDNFATIVTALRGGRGVYANVQKFIAFLFSGNFGVVLAVFAGTVAAGVLHVTEGDAILIPLTAAQILWMNLVTDGAPAVAFALGRTPTDVMDQPPRAPDEPVLPPGLVRYVLMTGACVAAALLVVLDLLYQGGFYTWRGEAAGYARTAGFYCLVTVRLWNALNFRHMPGSIFTSALWADFYVPAACFVSWALTVLVIYWTPAQQLLALTPLSLKTLLALTLLAPLVLLPGELYKRFVGIRMVGS